MLCMCALDATTLQIKTQTNFDTTDTLAGFVWSDSCREAQENNSKKCPNDLGDFLLGTVWVDMLCMCALDATTLQIKTQTNFDTTDTLADFVWSDSCREAQENNSKKCPNDLGDFLLGTVWVDMLCMCALDATTLQIKTQTNFDTTDTLAGFVWSDSCREAQENNSKKCPNDLGDFLLGTVWVDMLCMCALDATTLQIKTQTNFDTTDTLAGFVWSDSCREAQENNSKKCPNDLGDFLLGTVWVDMLCMCALDATTLQIKTQTNFDTTDTLAGFVWSDSCREAQENNSKKCPNDLGDFLLGTVWVDMLCMCALDATTLQIKTQTNFDTTDTLAGFVWSDSCREAQENNSKKCPNDLGDFLLGTVWVDMLCMCALDATTLQIKTQTNFDTTDTLAGFVWSDSCREAQENNSKKCPNDLGDFLLGTVWVDMLCMCALDATTLQIKTQTNFDTTDTLAGFVWSDSCREAQENNSKKCPNDLGDFLLGTVWVDMLCMCALDATTLQIKTQTNFDTTDTLAGFVWSDSCREAQENNSKKCPNDLGDFLLGTVWVDMLCMCALDATTLQIKTQTNFDTTDTLAGFVWSDSCREAQENNSKKCPNDLGDFLLGTVWVDMLCMCALDATTLQIKTQTNFDTTDTLAGFVWSDSCREAQENNSKKCPNDLGDFLLGTVWVDMLCMCALDATTLQIKTQTNFDTTDTLAGFVWSDSCREAQENNSKKCPNDLGDFLLGTVWVDMLCMCALDATTLQIKTQTNFDTTDTLAGFVWSDSCREAQENNSKKCPNDLGDFLLGTVWVDMLCMCALDATTLQIKTQTNFDTTDTLAGFVWSDSCREAQENNSKKCPNDLGDFLLGTVWVDMLCMCALDATTLQIKTQTNFDTTDTLAGFVWSDSCREAQENNSKKCPNDLGDFLLGTVWVDMLCMCALDATTLQIKTQTNFDTTDTLAGFVWSDSCREAQENNSKKCPNDLGDFLLGTVWVDMLCMCALDATTLQIKTQTNFDTTDTLAGFVWSDSCREAQENNSKKCPNDLGDFLLGTVWVDMLCMCALDATTLQIKTQTNFDTTDTLAGFVWSDSCREAQENNSKKCPNDLGDFLLGTVWVDMLCMCALDATTLQIKTQTNFDTTDTLAGFVWSDSCREAQENNSKKCPNDLGDFLLGTVWVDMLCMCALDATTLQIKTQTNFDTTDTLAGFVWSDSCREAQENNSKKCPNDLGDFLLGTVWVDMLCMCALDATTLQIKTQTNFDTTDTLAGFVWSDSCREAQENNSKKCPNDLGDFLLGTVWVDMLCMCALDATTLKLKHKLILTRPIP